MNIPKDLLREAMALSGAASQTMAVILGLQELIKKKRLEKLEIAMNLVLVRYLYVD